MLTISVTCDMAPEGSESLLSQQLSQAKDMGFSDSEIWAALEMNNPDKEKVCPDTLVDTCGCTQV